MIDKNKPLRSFGRIRSRIRDNENLLGKLLPKFLIKLDPETKINPKNLFENSTEIHLEVGYGYGASISERAKKNPDVGFIGCEVYINGILNLLRRITEKNIENIRLYDEDARDLLENLQNESLDKVFVLFPDPWPKNKHNKRRIINQRFLETIHSKLKKNGTLFFASDIEHYVNWTLEHIEKNGKFKNAFKDLEECKNEPEWWIRTKYQSKAIKEGRESKFLEFIKI